MSTEPITYAEAAALVGVPIDTVRQWKSRHYLDPVAWDRRRPLFLPDDVRKADEHARNYRGGRPRKDKKAA